MRRVTRVVRVDAQAPDPKVMAEAGLALRAGELVAFPTETVYGLGADAFHEQAVRRIFEVKGRPADNPVIVHVAAVDELLAVARPDPAGRWELLARRFWPGPLTMVLPCRPEVPAATTAGLDTVAVRMPRHAVALALIRAAGRPVAAPSANRSGRPSPSRAEHVLEDLNGLVEWVLDAGPCEVGVESTVLDLTAEVPLVLRPGGLSVEALREVLGEVALSGAEAGRPRSPGLKYRHYAPQAPTVVLIGPPQAVAACIGRELRQRAGSGRRLGLLITEETLRCLVDSGEPLDGADVFCTGSRHRLASVARALFEGLRQLDSARPERILAEAVEEAGLGLAINNRLRKAAGGRVVRCVEPP